MTTTKKTLFFGNIRRGYSAKKSHMQILDRTFIFLLHLFLNYCAELITSSSTCFVYHATSFFVHYQRTFMFDHYHYVLYSYIRVQRDVYVSVDIVCVCCHYNKRGCHSFSAIKFAQC